MNRARSAVLGVMTVGSLLSPLAGHATEGALGRPVAGTSVSANVAVIPDQPVWIANLQQLYMDGSISSGREVPIGGRTTAGIDAKIAFTLATMMRVWDTGPGAWNFASSFTLPYVWTTVHTSAVFAGPGGNTFSRGASDRASNLYDMYFSPLIAGYHFSKTTHMALSFNVWAPTGQYDKNALANPSLNNWTFVPQVAFTHLMPQYGLEFNAVAAFQFYTRNTATDYQNAPLFTLDVMGVKKFGKWGAGLVMGTIQQLGDDTGPTADRLNGFRGHDFTIGPIITYDTKLGGKAPLSFSLRWVPTVTSKNRLDSTATVMGTATLVF
ncbi:SphA family protein [Cupriavidus pauculus]|uniref:Transporter n=1 Tax=Cupriavidus pauculus TaxID=82633 RepID=A0A2N5C4P5_9BURK|nr:transporter [Cupriavidus pauculus]PLP97195.1 transporter [Cupriavidus pauculus]